MDHGSELGAHRRDENGDWDSEFRHYLGSMEIHPILACVKHPQTNGKVEKWSDTYDRFRYEYPIVDDFIVWYNKDPMLVWILKTLNPQNWPFGGDCLNMLSLV